jgi:hypothetical protein
MWFECQDSVCSCPSNQHSVGWPARLAQCILLLLESIRIVMRAIAWRAILMDHFGRDKLRCLVGLQPRKGLFLSDGLQSSKGIPNSKSWQHRVMPSVTPGSWSPQKECRKTSGMYTRDRPWMSCQIWPSGILQSFYSRSAVILLQSWLLLPLLSAELSAATTQALTHIEALTWRMRWGQ